MYRGHFSRTDFFRGTMAARCVSVLLACFMIFASPFAAASAAEIPHVETPDYKVTYYAFDCFNMMDENGRHYGYGYEMMQDISNYLQCTFSYVGYDKSAAECIDLLRNGEVDIYTAARKTPEREQEFAFSTHPAITAYTCMNVKVGNTSIVAGDYSTYEGITIGLLQRHTYNNKFLQWAENKGLTFEIRYYETPTELSKALVNGEVDALVNSYMGTPKDETIIENFGETTYYIMARKKDQSLIDSIDHAIDQMNIEVPNWRSDLYDTYYGAQELSADLTDSEQALLNRLKEENAVIKAVLAPDSAPYSYYSDGGYQGITADIFRATAERLGLQYEFLPAVDRESYLDILTSGKADVWLDADIENPTVGETRYRTTEPFLKTSVSLLRNRRAYSGIQRLAVMSYDVTVKEIIAANWPDAEIVTAETTVECVRSVVTGEVDGALLTTYTAQKLAREDMQNRLRTDIVQGSFVNLQMAVNAEVDRDFYELWGKTLSKVSAEIQDNVVQKYVDEIPTTTVIQYLFDHPILWVILAAAVMASVFFGILYSQSAKSRDRQKAISDELAAALDEARAATEAKNEFFSKMSHDIRTPLNVVLGMTQIAQKYKNDPERLGEALNNISTEGNYLLTLINSILDVNQLEHSHLELTHAPFELSECIENSIELLRPLADRSDRKLSFDCNCRDAMVVGDSGRLSQIAINIVSNAIKYTEPGGEIHVSLESLPGDRYRFVCADNGIGMSQEFLKHITEDYVRAEDSRISKVQGTGLGMSIVKGLTELMGGTLTVESELGKGSRFTVEVPLPAASEEQRWQVLAPGQESADVRSFEGKRVILAEDNALNAEIAIELLQSVGLSVDWAENGEIAVKMLEISAPGTYFAVFMDMQMPVMDGVEATVRIRGSSHADRDIPIIAMTANTFDADKRRCKEAGMSGYISKPVNSEAIEAVLMKIVRGRI